MDKYFFKCDISGIQSFIFNIPASGAAQELKKRSIFVTKTSEECLARFQKKFGVDKVGILYNGGGNFYVRVQSESNNTEIQNFIAEIQKSYLAGDIFPYIAFVKDNGDSVNKLLDEVNYAMQKAKLQRPLTDGLFEIKPPSLNNIDPHELTDINGQMPKDKDSNFLDFETIAKSADGDDKIAAMKLDVDNLGVLFRGLSEADYKTLSGALKNFFDGTLKQLIAEKNVMQNVYVVFSGGDDCFLIGTWNVLFDLAISIRNRFRDFQEELKQKIQFSTQNEITFSAGMIVEQPRYPMIRLVGDVEESLDYSKRTENKNSITVFGKTIKWNEFEQSKKIAAQLKILISDKGESRSLIERIKSSHTGFDKLQREAQGGHINIPKVWRLKYYLRNVKKENQAEIEALFENYAQAIVKTFMQKEKINNPDLYPVAARWAELLLKNKNE
jgi:CRISPR-associated protein Csm1